MQINIGTTDRGIRLIIGIVIVSLGLYFKSWWGLVGIIPLATATMRVCPAYLPFGLSSVKKTPKIK